MVDPAFRSPVVSPADIDSPGVGLVDLTGIRLQQRADGDSKPGTARRRDAALEWAVSPGTWTVAGGNIDPEAVDLTHVRAVFRISGPHAGDLLALLCSLDLSHDMFPNGAAARTLVADVTTELVRDDEEDSTSYLLVPSRSFGRHLWDALVDASQGVA